MCCKMPSFGLQNVAFCLVKAYLLRCKSYPFAMRLMKSGKIKVCQTISNCCRMLKQIPPYLLQKMLQKIWRQNVFIVSDNP